MNLTEIMDENGQNWLEYCSDDVGQCETRGELTKDWTVWVKPDGTRHKPILFMEQGMSIFAYVVTLQFAPDSNIMPCKGPAACKAAVVAALVSCVIVSLRKFLSCLFPLLEDECIFKSNQDQFKSWHLPGSTAMRPKTEGGGLMISGFRCWEHGLMMFTPHQMREIESRLGRPCEYFHEWSIANGGNGNFYSYHKFDYGKNREGYWDGEKMVKQVAEILAAVDIRYPDHDVRFLFDWSSCHDKMPSSAFNVSKFNVNAGFQFTKDKVQKPFDVSDLVLECEYPNQNVSFKADGFEFGVQRVCFQGDEKPASHAQPGVVYTGMPKGLRQLLWERGLLVDKMTKDGGKEKTLELSMVKVMGSQPDVQHQKSMLQIFIEEAGHHCVMLPKFHCEMNGIERVWGRAKWYTRAFCNYSMPALLKTVPRSLSEENITPQLHRRFARKARDYMRGYMNSDGQDAKSCEALVVAAKKKRLQHRATPPSEATPGIRLYKPWEKKKLLAKLAEHVAVNNDCDATE